MQQSREFGSSRGQPTPTRVAVRAAETMGDTTTAWHVMRVASSASQRTRWRVPALILFVAALLFAAWPQTAQAQAIFHEDFGNSSVAGGNAVPPNLPTADSTADAPYDNVACLNGLLRNSAGGITSDSSSDGDSSNAFLLHNTGDCDGYVAGQAVWKTLTPIAVEPNTSYSFSYWVALFNNTSPPALSQMIVPTSGSITMGTSSIPPAVVGTWVRRQVSFITDSTPGNSVTLQINNATAASTGNDFGLDDIQLALFTPPLQLCSESEQRAIERYWFFGNRGAIDFGTSGTTATAFLGTQNTVEGSTVVTDITGQLLFWSNGQSVFDRNSTAMPNGTGLNGNASATQTVAAFPSFSQPGIYFVVTTNTDVGSGPNGSLSYSVVDMSLNGGLGDVTTKNVPLGAATTASEALTAVPNADGTGFWVLTYTNLSPNLLAYAFDGDGPTGTVTTSILPSPNGNWYGSLYFSKDLSRLVALSSFGNTAIMPTIVRLLRFDAATGQAIEELSWNLPAIIGSGNSGYTADFSPNGDYVYATKIFGGGQLYRYHIAGATTGAAVEATMEALGTIGTNGGHVRRAPDGRMYVANRLGTALSVVNTPDALDAGYVQDGFALATSAESQFGLPQMVTGCPPLFDLGDVPDSYGTLLPGGAVHTVQGYDSATDSAPLMLGSLIDVESNGQPNAFALGDDTNGVDNEDGVTFLTELVPGQTAQIAVESTATGILNAWADFNEDGDFGDAGEQIFVDQSLTPGTNNLSFAVPATAVGNVYNLRFRLSTQSGLGPTGPAPDGEVEAYQINNMPSFPSCDARAFLFQGAPTDVFAVNLVTGAAPQVGDDINSVNINAVGYNPLDDYIYGMGWLAGVGSGIYRVGADFSVQALGFPASLPALAYNIGDFDNNGHYWLIDNDGLNSYQIDMDPGSPTYFQLLSVRPLNNIAGFSGAADLAFNPVDGYFYRTPRNTTTNRLHLWRFDPSTGLQTDLGATAGLGVLPTAAIGANYADAAGFIYGSDNNSGNIYRFNVTNNSGILFTNGPDSGTNDGARCFNAPISIDFGDAPESYGTLLVDGGARHAIPDYDSSTNSASLMLGSAIDVELDGQPNDNADGDDTNGVDDEDGVIPAGLSPGQPFNLSVNVTGNGGLLNAWIDWNDDGDFDDPGEQIATDVAVSNGANALTGSVPAGAVRGTTYARFRLSTQSGLGPTGSAPDGEVEDYQISIIPTITCSTDTGIFDTGSFLTAGRDNHWDVGVGTADGGPGSVVIWEDAYLVDPSIPAWTAVPLGNADWISFAANATHGALGDPPVDHYFRYRFSLAPEVLPSTFALSMDFYADNQVWAIYVNGVEQTLPGVVPQNPADRYFHNGFSEGTQAHTILTEDWHSGLNELVVQVSSAVPLVGFFGQITSDSLCADYGDAPESYGTLLVDDGARHAIPDYDSSTNSASLMLGSTVDIESDGQPNANADGDDTNGVDDEDGVTLPAVVAPGQTVAIPVQVTGSGLLNAWIDWNADGDFLDAGEQIATNVANPTSLNVTVPAGAALGTTYARFRLSTQSGLDPTSPALDGEVEDYRLTVAEPELSIAKQDALWIDADSSGAPSPGDTLRYTVVITNNGAGVALDANYADILDPNTALVVGSVTTTQGSITTGNGAGHSSVAVAIGDIPAGSVVTIVYDAVIDNPVAAGVTAVSNQGILTTSNPNIPDKLTDDPDDPTPDDPTETPINAQPVLQSFKRDSLFLDADNSGTPSPGDILQYNITIINSGNQTAEGIVFTDHLDPNVTIVPGSVSTDRGTISDGNDANDTTVVINVGTLPAGDTSANISYQVTINNPLPAGVTTISNQGIVTDEDPRTPDEPTDDPDDPDPNDPTETPIDAAPRIAAYKRDTLLIDADNSGTPSPGDTLLYNITIINSGNQAASGVVYIDNPDPNTRLVAGSVASSLGTIVTGNNAGDSSIRVEIGTLAGGDAKVEISYHATINSVIGAEVTTVSNQGLVTTTDPNVPDVPTDDPDDPAPDDPTETAIDAAPHINVYKTAILLVDADANDMPSPGDTLLYNVSIINSGNQAATDVSYADTPDANTELVVGSVSADRGTIAQGNNAGNTSVLVNVGTLPGGATAGISYKTTIDNPLPADVIQVSNQGLATGGNFPDEPSDDPETPGLPKDSTDIVIVAAPVLAAHKHDSLLVDLDGNGAAGPGETLLYNITIINSGNAAATGVTFTDTPDTNTQLVAGSVRTDLGSVVTGNEPGHTSIHINVGEIPGGRQVQINYQVVIDENLPESVAELRNQGIVANNNDITPCPEDGRISGVLGTDALHCPQIPTNDPATAAAGDPTITLIRRDPTAEDPTEQPSAPGLIFLPQINQ